MRKDEAEVEKCQSVADLILKGKSGVALESEIIDKVQRGPSASSGSSKRAGYTAKLRIGPTWHTDESVFRPTSRRGSAAVELSKGALRALRAQARQPSQNGSGDWSDASRANSLGPSVADSHEKEGASRVQGVGMVYDLSGQGEVPYQTEGFQPSYFASANEVMAYDHPDMAGWTFEQHAMSGGMDVDQDFVFPVDPSLHRGPDSPGSTLSPLPDDVLVNQDLSAQTPYTYPQPLRPIPTTLPESDFYAYDHALPFSSDANQPDPHHHQRRPQPQPNDAFTGYPMTEGPSPTSGMYGAIGRPMSARWDRSNHLLPPSSEVAFEGLSFQGGDMLLQGFEAAMTHADDMASAW